MLSRHLLFILITVANCISMAYGAVCTGENATTYLRSEGTRLMEFATHTIKDVTLNICADACTTESNGHVCSSFEYDARSQECSIHAEDGQPFGPSVLTKSDGPIAFFQQICVKAESLCSSPYAFERYPQSLLIGHAMKVVSVSGLSECLSRCLTAAASLNTQCRSLMYFYETGECIINRERRTDRPDLFVEGVQDQLVDYFENNCLDVTCFSGQLHWIRTEEYFISHEKDVIIESMSMEECKTVCQANLIGTERFPCRAFVYNAAKRECHLTAESGLIMFLALVNFNSDPFQVSFGCVDASFEQVPDRRMNSVPYKEFGSTSVHSCLAGCLDDGAQCATAVYNYEKDLCSLSETSQFSHPELFVPAENMDYFDKICDPAPSKRRVEQDRSAAEGVTTIPQTNAIDLDEDDRVTSLSRADAEEVSRAIDFVMSSTLPSNEISNVVDQKETEAEGVVIDDTVDFENAQRSHNAVKARLMSECRMSGITVKVEFATPTSGSIYIKDHFASCRTEFTNSTHSELNIPFPKNDDANPRCPGTETAPAMWSFSVVVQKNDMNSPSLVTSTDRLFNVSCDYTELLEKERSQAPPTDDEIDEIKSTRIEMRILREGRAVTTVPLGDEVELRWTIIDTATGLGYFVEECVAERVGGAPPEPEPLRLIQRGCPDEKVRNRLINTPIIREADGFSTKMKVFRFDGSRRVRIRCTIDVCVDHCPSVTCDGLGEGRSESFGRRKREAAKDMTTLLKKLKPSFATSNKQQRIPMTKRIVTGTITITEVEKKEKRPRPEFSSMPADQYCFMRSYLVAALVAFCILSMTQLFVLLNCLHSRCASVQDDVSYSSRSSSYISSCHYGSSSLDMAKPLPPTPSDLCENLYQLIDPWL
ncbi:hypothetical protein Y032_0511g2747 [Ancylostoma ceylanicum]|uniref:PAN domain protein n=1 Tax=Ancylostoma ceylanicum TaxID=53326 RepID=A0A016WSY7_9BILA|nr:hypothetical protein Y032_0511g2747 [Ancylostoma ceylanicum]